VVVLLPSTISTAPSLIAWEDKRADEDSGEDYDSDVEGAPLTVVEDGLIPPSSEDAALLDLVVVEEGCILWVKPPPITAPTPGKWSRWFEVRGKDRLPTMELQTSKAKHPVGAHICYDQKYRQQLFYSRKFTPAAGCISDPRVYGFPPPNRIYQEFDRRVPASQWVYLSRESGVLEGQGAPNPAPASLPFISTTLSRAPGSSPLVKSSLESLVPRAWM
jgi:hypothetical protein